MYLLTVSAYTTCTFWMNWSPNICSLVIQINYEEQHVFGHVNKKCSPFMQGIIEQKQPSGSGIRCQLALDGADIRSTEKVSPLPPVFGIWWFDRQTLTESARWFSAEWGVIKWHVTAWIYEFKHGRYHCHAQGGCVDKSGYITVKKKELFFNLPLFNTGSWATTGLPATAMWFATIILAFASAAKNVKLLAVSFGLHVVLDCQSVELCHKDG